MIRATNNKALIMIEVLVAITLIVATNLITQSASAFKSNGENIACVHPDSATYKLHNYDITTKQNDCYRTQYLGQQNFRNIPFSFRNVPFGSPFPYDYCTHPYFGQHKFRNDPFELPFP